MTTVFLVHKKQLYFLFHMVKSPDDNAAKNPPSIKKVYIAL